MYIYLRTILIFFTHMHFLLKLTVFIYAHKVAPPSTLYYDTPVQIWRMIKVLISH